MPKLQPQVLAGETPGIPDSGALGPTGGAARGLSAVASGVDAIVQVGERIADAKSTQEANLESTRLDAELESLRADGIDAEDFEKRSAALIKERTENVSLRSGQDRFKVLAESSKARIGQRVRDDVRKRDVDSARANHFEFIDGLSKQIAQSENDVEEASLLRQRKESIDEAIAQRIITAQEGRQLLESSEIEVARAKREELQRVDPKLGLELAKDPNGPFKDLPADEQEKTISGFEGQIKQNERFARARATEILTLERERRAAKKRAANAEMIALGRDATMDDLERLAPDLQDLSTINAWEAQVREGAPLSFEAAEVRRVRKLAAEDPNAFAKLELDAIKLGRFYAGLVDLQGQVIETGEIDVASKNLQSSVDKRIAALDLNDKDRDTFQIRAMEELEEFVVRNNGKKPSRAESQAIVDGLSLDFDESSLFFLSDVFGGLRFREESETAQGIGSIPAVSVEGVIDDLEDTGTRVTPEALQNRFNELSEKLTKRGRPLTPENIAKALEAARLSRNAR